MPKDSWPVSAGLGFKPTLSGSTVHPGPLPDIRMGSIPTKLFLSRNGTKQHILGFLQVALSHFAFRKDLPISPCYCSPNKLEDFHFSVTIVIQDFPKGEEA